MALAGLVPQLHDRAMPWKLGKSMGRFFGAKHLALLGGRAKNHVGLILERLADESIFEATLADFRFSIHVSIFGFLMI